VTVPVEALLAVSGALAQSQAEATPVRERLRQDAEAQAEMRAKVDAAYKEIRDAQDH
jgi:hypothetical protein